MHGEVTLSSGRMADYYVDMRRVTLDGAAAPVVGRVMRALVADWEFDAVGGFTLGADPVAVAMLHAAAADGERLDAFVVRKAQKEHGLQRQIEGSPVQGRRVLAVDDTSTTGGSVLTAVRGAARGRRGRRRGGRHRRPGHRAPGSRSRRPACRTGTRSTPRISDWPRTGRAEPLNLQNRVCGQYPGPAGVRPPAQSETEEFRWAQPSR